MRQALELALKWIEKQPEETPHSKYDVDTRYVVIREIEAALEQPEQPKVRTGDCLLVGVCASEGHKIQKAQPEQEPVAWLHTKLDGVVVPHRPADLDRHSDRWEALYRTPPPCPTCEALARTVMLDQTSHDTTPPRKS